MIGLYLYTPPSANYVRFHAFSEITVNFYRINSQSQARNPLMKHTCHGGGWRVFHVCEFRTTAFVSAGSMTNTPPCTTIWSTDPKCPSSSWRIYFSSLPPSSERTSIFPSAVLFLRWVHYVHFSRFQRRGSGPDSTESGVPWRCPHVITVPLVDGCNHVFEEMDQALGMTIENILWLSQRIASEHSYTRRFHQIINYLLR